MSTVDTIHLPFKGVSRNAIALLIVGKSHLYICVTNGSVNFVEAVLFDVTTISWAATIIKWNNFLLDKRIFTPFFLRLRFIYNSVLRKPVY